MTNTEMRILEIVKNNAGIQPDTVRREMNMAWFDFEPALNEMERNDLIREEWRFDWGRGNEYRVLFVGNGRRGPWD